MPCAAFQLQGGELEFTELLVPDGLSPRRLLRCSKIPASLTSGRACALKEAVFEVGLTSNSLLESVHRLAAAMVYDSGPEWAAVDVYADALLAREAIDSTFINEGVALPHARHPAVPGPKIGYFRSPDGIPLAGGSARVIICCFAAARRPGDYLGAVTQICRAHKLGHFNPSKTSKPTLEGWVEEVVEAVTSGP